MVATGDMKLSNAAKLLAAVLAVYVVCDILLTPLAGLETRPVAKVTTLGFVGLGLLFLGLALAIVAIVLVFRRSQRSLIVAIFAAVLFFPAFLSEQTGHFSAVRAPAAIEAVEVVQAVVAVIVVGLGLWARKEVPPD
jgi:hypothetical protein